MRFTLVMTQITEITLSVMEALLCALIMIQTIINGQPKVLHIVIYGTLAKKSGATLKGGTCTSLLIFRIYQEKTTAWSFAHLE